MGAIYNEVMKFKKKYPGGVSFRVKKHCKVLEEYINSDEKLLYAFPAQKNESFTDIYHTFVVALTDKRILLGHKRLLWGSFYYTITPDLYNDMQIFKGLIWGKITIDTVKELMVLSNLPKNSLDEIETVISEFMMEAKKKYKNAKEK